MNPLHYVDICRVLAFGEVVESGRDYESMPKMERAFGREILWIREDLVPREEPIIVPKLEMPRRR